MQERYPMGISEVAQITTYWGTARQDVSKLVDTMSLSVDIARSAIAPGLFSPQQIDIVRATFRMLAQAVAGLLSNRGNNEVGSGKTPESPNSCKIGTTCHHLPPFV